MTKQVCVVCGKGIGLEKEIWVKGSSSDPLADDLPVHSRCFTKYFKIRDGKLRIENV